MKNSDSSFSFQYVLNNKITKTIKKEKSRVKRYLNYSGFLSDYIYINFNKCIKEGEYMDGRL